MLGGDDIAVRSRGDLIDGVAAGGGAAPPRGSGPRRGAPADPGSRAGHAEVHRGRRARGLRGRRRPDAPPPAARGREPRRPRRLRAVRREGRARGRRPARTSPSPPGLRPSAYAAVMFDAVGGGDAAAEMVSRWSGRALDPAIAAIFAEAPAELLGISSPDDLWAAVVEAEPPPRRTFRDEAALDEALAGFGDAADLKTPWFHGHSGGVARLARAAAAQLTAVDPTLVYRAGLLHDLGRVAVPTGIWERPGPLRPEEWELVRLHPYQSGRILARSPVLAPLGPIASRHHERVDGSGYPAGVRASELDAGACLLAAADVLHALGEPRPHRPALDPPEASRVLSGMPLDRDAIRAVLDAAGAPPPELPPLPGRPDRARARRPAPARRRAHQARDRRGARDLAVDRAHPHGAHLRQVRRLDAGRPRDVRDAARACEPGPLSPPSRRSTEQSIVGPKPGLPTVASNAPDRRSHA